MQFGHIFMMMLLYWGVGRLAIFQQQHVSVHAVAIQMEVLCEMRLLASFMLWSGPGDDVRVRMQSLQDQNCCVTAHLKAILLVRLA